MFTEREFIRSYSSFWRDTIPFCEAFVRYLNLNYVEPYTKEVASSVAPNRRAIVNELAFELFAQSAGRSSVDAIVHTANRIQEVYSETLEKMRRFAGFGLPQGRLTHHETAEAIRLARHIEEFFSRFEEAPTVHPSFPGCGMLEAVEGDVFVVDTLFEVKGGDRPFRGVDVRQLLTYCALNDTCQRYDIRRVGLVNPRTGLYFSEELGVLCVRVSGEGQEAVLGRIQEFLSGALASP